MKIRSIVMESDKMGVMSFYRCPETKQIIRVNNQTTLLGSDREAAEYVAGVFVAEDPDSSTAANWMVDKFERGLVRTIQNMFEML